MMKVAVLKGSVAKVVYAEDWNSLDTCSTQVWPTLLCDVIYLITLWCYSLLSDKSVCQKWLLFEKTIVILESNPRWWQGLPAKHCGQGKIWLRFDSVALLIEMLIESLFVHFWQWSGYSALLWNSTELFRWCIRLSVELQFLKLGRKVRLLYALLLIVQDANYELV